MTSAWYRRLWARDEPANFGQWALLALLAPTEWLYRGGVEARSWAYDRGLLRSTAAALPTICVGNLTVGGTGKTPLAAWFVSALLERGRAPAVVMRGYGGDEVVVHRILNPEVSVIASADRVAGVRAAADAGADSVVLDDAFQHRAIRADQNVVLVAAEDWHDDPRLLPRGPWREGLGALRRATLAVVTRKVAQPAFAAHVAERVAAAAPGVPVARAYLGLSGLVRFEGAAARQQEGLPLGGFRCALAVAGVAKPETVWDQLEAAGVRVDERRAFSDHHRYSAADIEMINKASASGPLVATLKDAVKLKPLLATNTELYVPLQRVEWEDGTAAVDTAIERSLEKRQSLDR
jgi:tetraacyldisaccharide 4'-kinase